ncbi:acetate kinase [Robiginitalea sp. M366]|uniref:acetate/propionate family kinase n=1 Tax=Robiginitalea aestuariiviva TaxID=3036903 RepID=UPI00240D7B48|nr:acetate kinase [Robiginitalea aestuariiviva]MDG1572042.1 acetate kinase [Robiginitalea aestuariiviva]
MQTKILVLNSGSSSLKFQLLKMPSEQRLCQGLVERIGGEGPRMRVKAGGREWESELDAPDHGSALEAIVQVLTDPQYQLLEDAGQLAAVGHRVVHGGPRYNQTVAITEDVKQTIEELSRLAPLHNPPNLEGIRVAEACFPRAVQVAVFDTAYHRSIPEHARRYALPEELYQEHDIQVFGFHGTSHQYVAGEMAAELPADGKMVSLHLGNGCSATAIRGGKSVDHSLGFTPGNGLIMGSRSGDIDHGIVLYLAEALGYKPGELRQLFNAESGLKGLTGYSDLRDVEAGEARGDAACRLALEMTAYRIRKYIGAYAAAMDGLDALVFTAGIGEHSSRMRELVCRGLTYLGLHLDAGRNQNPGEGKQAIHTPDSRVSIWIVPTDEELEIARQTYAVLGA